MRLKSTAPSDITDCQTNITLNHSKRIGSCKPTSCFGQRYLSRYSESLWAGRSGDRTPVRAIFFAPNHTISWAHPASCKMGTGSFPGVKRPGCGVDHPAPTNAEVKERVELYLYFPSGASLLVIRSWPFLACWFNTKTRCPPPPRICVSRVIFTTIYSQNALSDLCNRKLRGLQGDKDYSCGLLRHDTVWFGRRVIILRGTYYLDQELG
jgi:hypothetical protein